MCGDVSTVLSQVAFCFSGVNASVSALQKLLRRIMQKKRFRRELKAYLNATLKEFDNSTGQYPSKVKVKIRLDASKGNRALTWSVDDVTVALT